MVLRKSWLVCRKHPRWVVAAFVLSVGAVFVLMSGAAMTDQAAPVTGQLPGQKIAQPQQSTTDDTGLEPALLSNSAAADQTLAAVTIEEQPDEAIWVDGELMPPLPRDPDLRKAALEEARMRALASPGVPDVTYQGVPAGIVTNPGVGGETPRSVAAYQPTEREIAEVNVRIPDDFKIPADVLRELSESATIDEATETRMEGTLAQALIKSFHGIDQTSLTPPDCDLAVNADYIVLVVNSDYAVYDKCGTQLVQNSLASLSNMTAFIFDPKVVYDEWDGRWILSYAVKNTATNESWIELIISMGTTPPGVGGWWYYGYSWTNNGGWWGDYPDLGVDPDCVYITTNDFNWASPPVFQRARIAVLDKAQIYVGGVSSRSEFYAMTNPGDATLAFALRATEMNSWPGKYLLVNSKPGGGSILTLWEITGAPAAPVLNGFSIPVGTYDDPPPLIQPNATYVDCGDARLLTSKYYSFRLWTPQSQRVNWGEPTDRSAIEIYVINTSTRAIQAETGGWGQPGNYYAYPAVDLDPLTRGIICFSRGGPAEFVGTRYTDYTEGGAFATSGLLVSGQANYAGGGSGTLSSPYRWGDYYGCDIDRASDNRTFWFYGQFASSSPVPSWDTWVGAASFETAPLLNITPVNSPSTPFESTGLQGGPFTPPGITYTLQNLGGSAVTWTLTNVDSWNTASGTKGQILPSQSTNVSVNINANANSLAPAAYTDSYTFTNCLQGGSATRATRLTVGIDGSCPGSVVKLIPDAPPDFVGTDVNQERGAYVTALKDFEVCAIGWKADLVLPQTLTARIYAANGTTRGALLATGTLTAVQPGNVIHYIPIDYTLNACQEYDISVQFGITNSWDWWDDRPIKPFDVGGVIRVRDGEATGGASNFALPYYSIVGTPAECDIAADLDPKKGTTNWAPDDNQDRGIYIKAEETVALCSFGWRSDLVAPQTVTARVYEATGTTRGALVAEGTLVVTSSGMAFHDVPINYVLEEGKEYDLSIQFGATTLWPWWSELELTEPYTVGAIRVVNAEMFGNATNTALPHYRVGYTLGAAGVGFDLAKKNGGYPPPYDTDFGPSAYGTYVKSLINQEVYSLGWMANVVEGQVIRARVYAATGTTRGALISEGEIVSAGTGPQWHDIPVAASLAANADYDFEIEWGTVIKWRYWDDRTGLPYDPYGVIRVVNSENYGDAGNYALIHMRMNACNVTATAIGDEPVQPPPFALMAPFPNPLSSSATIPFSLEEAGPVTIIVYDVLGRRVATILSGDKRPAGRNQAEFKAKNLAAGVYFVKMEANQKSVSRKITIVR